MSDDDATIAEDDNDSTPRHAFTEDESAVDNVIYIDYTGSVVSDYTHTENRVG